MLNVAYMSTPPETLNEFLLLCGGNRPVARVAGLDHTRISQIRKKGKWPRSRKVLEQLSRECGVPYREEWLDEIEPQDALLKRKIEE